MSPWTAGLLALAAAVRGGTVRAQDDKFDTAKIEEITRLKGTWSEDEGTFKVATPRMLFLHYWGEGKAEDLARAVKTAVDTQKR